MFITCLLGVILVLLILRDAFASILLPRTVRTASRFSSRMTSAAFFLYSRLVRRGSNNEDNWLSLFGPLSIVAMIGIWAGCLITGFSCIVYGCQFEVGGRAMSLGECFYFSGETFFTLGYGDMTLPGALGHTISVIEAGLGFGFLAVVISYVPVLYQTFSRREVLITLMDARGGSPPSGGEMIVRFIRQENWAGLQDWLERWEVWAAELLETHLSYPVLVYYRSQHSDTGWLCAMTATMDACAFLLSWRPNDEKCEVIQRQAQLTYAMCRHAVVDLSQVLGAKPQMDTERLMKPEFDRLVLELSACGMGPGDPESTFRELKSLRRNYEPFVVALSNKYRLSLPTWTKVAGAKDNWETSAWDSHM